MKTEKRYLVFCLNFLFVSPHKLRSEYCNLQWGQPEAQHHCHWRAPEAVRWSTLLNFLQVRYSCGQILFVHLLSSYRASCPSSPPPPPPSYFNFIFHINLAAHEGRNVLQAVLSILVFKPHSNLAILLVRSAHRSSSLSWWCLLRYKWRFNRPLGFQLAFIQCCHSASSVLLLFGTLLLVLRMFLDSLIKSGFLRCGDTWAHSHPQPGGPGAVLCPASPFRAIRQAWT